MLMELDGRLRRMWKEDSGAIGNILQQILLFARSMGTLPVCDVRNLLFGLKDGGFPLLCRGRGKPSKVEAQDGNGETDLYDC
jgi:hypothetical protein